MPDLPELVMGDLVPLLYRARWIRFGLSGEVRSRVTRAGADEDAELNGSVLAAPGGRYRADLADEDGDRRLMICDEISGGVPFPALLDPAWLLADYDLRVTAQTEHLGRPAYAVAGSPRLATDHRPGRPSDRVSALVDAELGILLRYAETSLRGHRDRGVRQADHRPAGVGRSAAVHGPARGRVGRGYPRAG